MCRVPLVEHTYPGSHRSILCSWLLNQVWSHQFHEMTLHNSWNWASAGGDGHVCTKQWNERQLPSLQMFATDNDAGALVDIQTIQSSWHIDNALLDRTWRHQYKVYRIKFVKIDSHYLCCSSLASCTFGLPVLHASISWSGFIKICWCYTITNSLPGFMKAKLVTCCCLKVIWYRLLAMCKFNHTKSQTFNYRPVP